MISTEAGAASDSGPGSDAWLTPGRFAALLGVFIIACFPQVIGGLETFFYRDYALFGYPLAAYHRETFWRGEVPLWNPLNDCGLPFLAQWNTLTLYPLSLFYLLLPLTWALGVFCLGHLFLAGMGMYFLGCRWTGNRLAGAVTGMAFAFNGLTWHALMWPNDIAALGWMPWVVLAMERAWREGGRGVVLGGLAGAMQMLAGAPEIIIETWFCIGGVWLVQLLMREIPPTRMLVRAVCAGMLVAALSAAQLLPFLDLLAHSQRDTTFGDSLWAMPASGWANYLVPLFHLRPAGRGVYVQHDQYWTSSYFLGVGIVALALFAVLRARHWRVRTLAALALFSLVMALGDHGVLFAVLRKIAPQIGFMRFPIKFVVLATFALPLLAAFGVSRLRSLSDAEWPRERKFLGGITVMLLALMPIILFFAWKFPQEYDDLKMTIFSGVHSAVVLALVVGCLLLVQRKAEIKAEVIFQISLLVLLWFDVRTHILTLSPTVSPTVYGPGLIRQYLTNNHSLTSDAQLRPGQSRVMESRASLEKMYWGLVDDPALDVLGRRVALYDNINLLDDIPKIDGFYSLYLREMSAILNGLYTTTNDTSRLKDFLGVSQVNDPAHTMDWTNRATASPLVTAGQEPVFLDDQSAYQALFNPAFDPRQMVLLSPEAKAVVQAHHADVKIVSTNFSAQRIGLQVDAASPGMVVIAQAYYHPWHAYVDGQATTLWRANYAFQALEVPAGSHRVEIIYQDARFRAGAIISLASLLGSGVFWVARRKRPEPGRGGK